MTVVAHTLELVPLATMEITMSSSRMDGTPVGTRVIVEYERVVWTGDRMRAVTRGHVSGDWLTVGADLTSCFDIRILLETDDGALVYVYGIGRTDAGRFLQGGANYFALTFETGDERYRWLNRVQAVAKGAVGDNPRVATFDVYELR